MSKETLRNDLKTKCDSCGNTQSCKKYNNAYMCISCLKMDKRGIPRDNQGKIFNSSKDNLVLNIPNEKSERLRKARKSSR